MRLKLWALGPWVVIVTPHAEFDLSMVVGCARYVLDTRRAAPRGPNRTPTLTRFVLPFELLAVLMLAAMLGAVYFARPEDSPRCKCRIQNSECRHCVIRKNGAKARRFQPTRAETKQCLNSAS